MLHFVEGNSDNQIKTENRLRESSPYEYRMNLKENDLVYFLTKNGIQSARIKKINGKIHGLLEGWALNLILDDDKSICSWWCFPCPEDICEFLIERIANEEREASRPKNTNFDKADFPKVNRISPKLLSDDFISVQPLSNYEQKK
jgi:hypothetical protein